MFEISLLSFQIQAGIAVWILIDRFILLYEYWLIDLYY